MVAGDRVWLVRDLGLELLGRTQHLEPLGVELRRTVPCRFAELFTVGVIREHCELRLRRANRKLLALELDPRGENGVLERVLALRELGRDDSGLAGLPQPVQPLAIVVIRSLLLGCMECFDLLTAEEIPITGDDLRPLRDLLLADPDRAPLLGTVIEIAAELGLVLGRCANGGDAHRARQSSATGNHQPRAGQPSPRAL